LAMATATMAADDPFVGTWKLNLGKSTITGPSPKSMTLTITTQNNGIKVVTDRVGPDDKTRQQENIYILDGKEHPITDNPSVDTTIGTRVDANTIAQVLKKGADELVNTNMLVSKDGKTLTVIAKIQGQDTSNIRVYDKQ